MASLLPIAAALLAIATITDLLWRRIPNVVVIALLALWFAKIAETEDLSAALLDFLAALALFVVLLFGWSRGALGAGDVKLATVVALVVGHAHLIDFLLWTSVMGGVLATLIVGDARLNKYFGRSMGLAFPSSLRAPGTLAIAQPSVPYAVAILAGALLSLFSSALKG
jgi:prepilin peptidase CpaA